MGVPAGGATGFDRELDHDNVRPELKRRADLTPWFEGVNDGAGLVNRLCGMGRLRTPRGARLLQVAALPMRSVPSIAMGSRPRTGQVE